VSVKNAAAPPFSSQRLVPHPLQLSAAVAGGGGARSLRRRRAWRTGGRGGAGAEAWRRGGEGAGWSGCRRKESGAGTQATRNRHCGQLRRHRALPRLPRPECSCRAGFLRWVAEAAAVAVVVSTRPPSHGSIAAPIPRSPASGGARRRGFGRHTVGSGGRWEQPWERSGPRASTGGCTRPTRRHCSGSTRGASPLSTAAVAAGRQRSSFVSAPCGGGRAAAVAAAAAARWWPLAVAQPLPSAGRRSLHTRAVERHGALYRGAAIARSPPTPHWGRAECDSTVGRPVRPPLPHQSGPPVPTTTTSGNNTSYHRRNTCMYYLNTFQRARGRIADGAQSSFGTAPFRLQRDKTQRDLPVKKS
jgi:hypothetical protein